MPGYPMMELERREPIHLGEIQYWRVYWKYPDGRKIPFKTDTWNGIQPVEVKNVRREEEGGEDIVNYLPTSREASYFTE